MLGMMRIPRFMLHRQQDLAPGVLPKFDPELVVDLNPDELNAVEVFKVALMFSSESAAQKFIDCHPLADEWRLVRLDDADLLKLFDRAECYMQFAYIAVDHANDPNDKGKHVRSMFEPKAAAEVLKKSPPSPPENNYFNSTTNQWEKTVHDTFDIRWVEEFRGSLGSNRVAEVA